MARQYAQRNALAAVGVTPVTRPRQRPTPALRLAVYCNNRKGVSL